MSLADVTAVPALGHATLAPLRELIESPAVEVVSTDIFDTLLWRAVAEPVFAFELVGNRLRERGHLSESLLPGAFAGLRRTSERRARERFERDHGSTEIRLSEIYDAMPAWVFNGAGRHAGMDAELEVERSILTPDLDVLELLVSAHEAGKTVIAVSDTYFSADQLRFLLGQEALAALPLRHIFSSSDHRDNKSGRLFDIVTSALEVAPERILHMGDHAHADVAAPKRQGIRVALLERRTGRMQALLGAEARFAGPATALVAAGPKLAGLYGDAGLSALRAKMEHRAELAEAPSALAPFWRFGAQVHGPVFTGFAEWVHERARAAGADTAFCLMREGHFLAQLLDGGTGGVAEPVRAEKLWLNRSLCMRAAVGAATVEEIEPLFFRRTPPTVAEVCSTLGISLADVPSLAGHADTRLEDPVVRALLLQELTEGTAQRRVAAEARAVRERLVRYVIEAVGDADPIVLVDLGWGATIQARLASALRQAGVQRRIVGLYLVTDERAGASVGPDVEVEGFLANLGVPWPVVDIVLRAPEVLEQACMPGHGPQRDVSADLEPVVDPGGPHQAQHVEAEALRRGVLAFQREYLRYHLRMPHKIRPLGSAPDLLAPILMRSIAQPTAEEADRFGRWMHDENMGSDATAALTGAEWEPTLRHLAPDQLPRLPMQDLYWPYGLATAQDPALAELAAAVKAGLLSEDAAAPHADTGELVVEVLEGVGKEGSPRHSAVPRRNRHGLSFVSQTLNCGSIERLQIKPGTSASVMRIDWLQLRLWQQGDAQPKVVRLESPADLARLDRTGILFVAPNLFVTMGADTAIGVATGHWAERIVFRADVELAFAAFAIPTPVPGPGSPQALASADAVRRQMEASLSWRITRPLRSLKRLAR